MQSEFVAIGHGFMFEGFNGKTLSRVDDMNTAYPTLTGVMEILLVEDNLEDARLTMRGP